MNDTVIVFNYYSIDIIFFIKDCSFAYYRIIIMINIVCFF